MPGGNIDDNSMFALFWVTISLSTKGLANWIYVVQALYRYLHMLRMNGPQEWVHQEIQRASEIKFGLCLCIFHLMSLTFVILGDKLIWTKKKNQIWWNDWLERCDLVCAEIGCYHSSLITPSFSSSATCIVSLSHSLIVLFFCKFICAFCAHLLSVLFFCSL